MATIIQEILTILTLFSGIAIILFLLLSILEKILKRKIGVMNDIRTFTQKHALLLSFIVALAATLGSLFYSEILKYNPCKLCWFQRVFMYPLPIILGIAKIKKDIKVKRYVIPLTIIGAIIAVYHYIIQRLDSAGCSPDAVIPCVVKYTFKYGYITIPIMALTAFILITIILSIKRKNI
jgi:disulfide bond formation protein DsbB